MKSFWHQILALLLTLSLLLGASLTAHAENTEAGKESTTEWSVEIEEGSLNLPCKSAVLMEATTGTVLYRQNANEALPPASVTKIMTLLLVMEALQAGLVQLDSTVTVSANAASMGGSQIFLEAGEKMTLEDLLKSVVIASANDAAVALAEFIAGSVPSFVEKMNRRAQELGMKNTHFENVTGLDDTATSHLTSAYDIALMSSALIGHKTILKYSSIWMDSIRNGEFGLTNTNRLVRFYPGCTGLKTGSTSKAGFCVSVTAERDGLSLICVIMGAKTRDTRNAVATQLLDWGFAEFGLYTQPAKALDPIAITGASVEHCTPTCNEFRCVVPKSKIKEITTQNNLPVLLKAPVSKGECIGSVDFYCDNVQIGRAEVTVDEEIARINLFGILSRIFSGFLLI